MKRFYVFLIIISLFMTFTALAQPVISTSSTTTSIFFEPVSGETPFLNAIKSAKTSIKIEMYVITANDIFNALESAVNRGVNVQVILEHHPYNMQAQADYAYNALTKMGAHVQWAPSRFTFDHAKVMIIDDSYAIFGTSNLTYSGIAQNFEANVETHDPQIVKALLMVFNADWNNTQAGSAPREYLVLSPNSESDLVWLINSAQHTLLVAEEEVPEGKVFTALENAAQRGVDVKLIEPESSAKSMSSNYALSQLAVAGVKVGILKSPYVHAKMIVSDNNYLFIGSENVSYTSMMQNREVGIILSNNSLISQATNQFNELWRDVSLMAARLPSSEIALLTQIAGNSYNYMNKLVKTVGTVEAVFGPTVFISSTYNGKIAGLELWLGSVANSELVLKPGDTVRVVGSVDTYRGQLEIEAVSLPEVISKNLLPLPFEPSLDKIANYNGLTVMIRGTVKVSNDGVYIVDKDGKTIRFSSLGMIPPVSDGTEIYAEGIIVKDNANYLLAATNFYSAANYTPILEGMNLNYSPSLKDLISNVQSYFNQTITSTGIVSAVVSASNAYLFSNGYGIRIYGQHGNIKPGDIVQFTGTFTSYDNSLEVDITSFKVIGSTTPPAPTVIKTGDYSKYSEVLVQVSGTVSNAKGNLFQIDDGSGPATVYLSKGNLPKNGSTVTVIGISYQYKDIHEIYAISIY
ncbi:phospholipase D-like domain-containing protein [Athalassotoga saccharophila]|uniref:phospholipase D-like domain-containing protein n=1 Tax=Athalassotoga saccharophila TaxID=1441386 RepID=UPI001379FA86|nr:phospholipase D-like domain-containing protein [Athalassotoga saccharophila]BBJ28029.1 phospholipase D Transphosphatidylase [Athalassotoga saccharophila]